MFHYPLRLVFLISRTANNIRNEVGILGWKVRVKSSLQSNMVASFINTEWKLSIPPFLLATWSVFSIIKKQSWQHSATSTRTYVFVHGSTIYRVGCRHKGQHT